MATEIMRLDKWLSQHGIGSRKEVGKLIRKGFVVVNGEVVIKPEMKVSQTDDVVVDGESISLSKYVYYMMNKPKGVLSATRDKSASTVLDILPDELRRPNLFPAGRLDKDTEGFLIITNDGDFSHKILSPKNKVPKTYLVTLDKPFDEDELIKLFSGGIYIGKDEKASPSQLKVLSQSDKPVVELVIYEGMFHQVKRMFSVFGLEVVDLKRTQIGGLELDPNLELGETREIDATELEKIMSINQKS